MERTTVIDAIANIADDIAGTFNRNDETRFLVWFDFGKNLSHPNSLDQGRITHRLDLLAGNRFRIFQSHFLTEGLSNQMIITSDDFQLDPKGIQASNGGRNFGSERILKDDKAA